jgi:hypothetical protein
MWKLKSIICLHPASMFLVVLGLQVLCGQDATLAADAEATAVQVIAGDKAGEDPFLGDWQGSWSKGFPRQLVAQIIPRGGGDYVIRFVEAFDQRCAPLAIVRAKAEGQQLTFDHDGWSGSVVGEKLAGTGLKRNAIASFTLTKVKRLSPRLGARPPAGAAVLFDGGDLDQWESDGRDGSDQITWQKTEDWVRVWPPLTEHAFGSALRTRQAWPNFRLHLEFRLPLIAEATGQTRANSGIIIEEYEFVEVQILDSYGLPGYWDECGGIYRKESPKFNMCAPPGQWQSYDITYYGPRLDNDGKLIAAPRITVDLNGKRIHNDVELPYSERAVKNRLEKPDLKTPGRIILQHHGDPIDFRNVWLVELANRENRP